MHIKPRALATMTGALLGAVLLAGCASTGSTPRAAATQTATVTPPASTPSTPPPTATTRPTPSTSAAPVPAGAPRCTADKLTGVVGERNGAPAGTGDGMNQLHDAIILTNTGAAACSLQGWPGVSLVGDGNGTQLGAAAKLDRTTPHPTLTIAPGGKVQAPLDYVNGGVYDPAKCQPKLANGLRVYPPGSRTSLYIAHELTACTLTTYDLMTVGAFVSYP